MLLVFCLGSTIIMIKKLNYDVQNKMLFLFTRINKKDIKNMYKTLKINCALFTTGIVGKKTDANKSGMTTSNVQSISQGSAGIS